MSKAPVWTPTALPGYMQHQPIYDALATWMQPLTLDTVIELWWEAQRRRAGREEHNARRVAEPNDCYGKSPEWVAAYYAKQEPTP